MTLETSHSGHRLRQSHWLPYQFIDVRMVGPTIVIGRDEDGRELIFKKDTSDDWLDLGTIPPVQKPTPSHF